MQNIFTITLNCLDFELGIVRVPEEHRNDLGAGATRDDMRFLCRLGFGKGRRLINFELSFGRLMFYATRI